MADLPPTVANKLNRWPEPVAVDLQGPGPFQLQPVAKIEGVAGLRNGHLEIQLENTLGQELRLALLQSVAALLRQLISAELSRQAEGATGEKN